MKDKYFPYFVMFCIGILVGILILMIAGYDKEEIEVGEYMCWDDPKVWFMYNEVWAEQRGITQEDLVNISYAYLYNYSIDTNNWWEDAFIEIPSEECCYVIKDEWYCRESY